MKNLANKTATQRLGGFALIAVLLVVTLPLAGCPQQSTLAALVTTLGNAAASIASFEGNTALAQKLKIDVAAASQAVLNWKSGTPPQMAIEALTLVEDDLNLFPVASVYTPLIDLAIGTTISIIELLNPANPTPAVGATNRRAVHLASPPKSAKQFKAQWNAIVKQHPELVQAEIH